MHKSRFLFISLAIFFIGSVVMSDSMVKGSQYMLNQLGYEAGTEDGIKGKNTIKALTKFYIDTNQVFDGTIDENELIDLKSFVVNSGIPKIEDTKNKLKVTFFGNFISNQSRLTTDSDSAYFLPSDLFQRKNAAEHREVFFINHMAFGNLNNDSRQDLLMSYEIEVCPDGYTLTSVGVPLCELKSDNDLFLNFTAFSVSVGERDETIIENFEHNTPIGRNCQRPILADFNNDGTDDVYCPSAFAHTYKGKLYYGGADVVFISNEKGWKHVKEKGAFVDKKTGLYQGFSHGVTVNDIDHDGDLDVVTPHIKWENTKGGGKLYCHLNDGKGNFFVKVCGSQFANAVTSGDYNGDGFVDLVASGGWFEKKLYSHNSSRKHNNTVVLFGDGKGNFTTGWKKVPPAYDIYGSGYLLSHVVDLVSWDFDGDGDLDIAGTTVGPLYAGGTHTIWSNNGEGKFTIADQIPMVSGKKEWTSVKAWKKDIKSESNRWNSYCGSTKLIDVNNDSMMDMYCDSPTQDRHGGWIFLNMGGLQFKKISPLTAWSNDWIIYYSGPTGYSLQKFEGYSDPDFFETHWEYKPFFNK